MTPFSRRGLGLTVVLAAVCLAIFIHPARAQSVSSFRDDFTSSTLDPGWVVRPGIGLASLTDRPGFLRFTFNGTTFPGDSNSLWVYREFSGTDWRFETKVAYSMPPGNGRQHLLRLVLGGLDQRRFNELTFWRDRDFGRDDVYGDALEGGVLADRTQIAPNAADTYYVRITRHGQELTMEMSPDGEVYAVVAHHTYATPLPGFQTVSISGSVFAGAGHADYDYVAVDSLGNHPPAADAGADLAVEATGADTDVELSGSASSDPDSDPLTYEWRENGVLVGTTAVVTLPLSVGEHAFTLTVSDGQAIATATTHVSVLDTTPPVLIGVPTDRVVGATSSTGASVVYPTPSATDLVDGSVATVCSPPSGSSFPLGKTTVTCSAADGHGNIATASFTVWVVYQVQFPLAPIKADGSSVFKLGSTVPVKFSLFGAGAGITDTTARLTLQRVNGSEPVGDPVDATPSGNSSADNTFRYDPPGIYIFNWSSKGLSVGSYELRLDLGDGLVHRMVIGLK